MSSKEAAHHRSGSNQGNKGLPTAAWYLPASVDSNGVVHDKRTNSGRPNSRAVPTMSSDSSATRSASENTCIDPLPIAGTGSQGAEPNSSSQSRTKDPKSMLASRPDSVPKARISYSASMLYIGDKVTGESSMSEEKVATDMGVPDVHSTHPPPNHGLVKGNSANDLHENTSPAALYGKFFNHSRPMPSVRSGSDSENDIDMVVPSGPTDASGFKSFFSYDDDSWGAG